MKFKPEKSFVSQQYLIAALNGLAEYSGQVIEASRLCMILQRLTDMSAGDVPELMQYLAIKGVLADHPRWLIRGQEEVLYYFVTHSRFSNFDSSAVVES